MPYNSNEELPSSVRSHLPPHAQDIFREAFNNAWDQYADPKKRRSGASHEVVSMKVAWSAVKKEYHKDPEGKWVPN